MLDDFLMSSLSEQENESEMRMRNDMHQVEELGDWELVGQRKQCKSRRHTKMVNILTFFCLHSN